MPVSNIPALELRQFMLNSSLVAQVTTQNSGYKKKYRARAEAGAPSYPVTGGQDQKENLLATFARSGHHGR